MGNLNQFYLMGRVASPPATATSSEGKPVVTLAILPGSGGRAPRGPLDPLDLEAHGPQVDAAKALQVGQAVLLRGQLRQERRGGSGEARLVARVQAIEILAPEGTRPPRERGERGERGEHSEGEGTARRRRRRRGRGRGRDDHRGSAEGGSAEGGSAEGASPEGGSAEGAPLTESAQGAGSASAPAEPVKSVAADLPPPKPLAAPVNPQQPLPDSTPDMPF